MSGAWVRRATLQAADGAPMPTKHTSSLDRARAAAIVIISLGVKSGIVVSQSLHAGSEGLGPYGQHVVVHPSREQVAIGGDPVPLEIGGIVAVVIAVGVGGMGPARHLHDRRHGPMG